MAETRVALVTGGNKGIGLETVRQLAGRGITTVLGSRDADKGRAAAAALKKDGLDVPVLALDVTSEKSVQAAVGEVKRQFQRLDILVNNAAILIDGPGGFSSSLFDVKHETFEATFETNLYGPLRLTQAVVPLMRTNNYGRIVNISSAAGQFAEMGMGFPVYRMSKTALNALTRITAAEVGKSNIKVNSACPGWVRTDMGGPQAERSVKEGAETPVWLATLPDKGFFVILRLYGPTKTFFDKTWKPSDLEKLN